MPVYVVRGEDPNCDYGGMHYNPSLGYFEGDYDDVLALAKTLPRWKTYGRGGHIEEIKIVKIERKSK